MTVQAHESQLTERQSTLDTQDNDVQARRSEVSSILAREKSLTKREDLLRHETQRLEEEKVSTR